MLALSRIAYLNWVSHEQKPKQIELPITAIAVTKKWTNQVAKKKHINRIKSGRLKRMETDNRRFWLYVWLDKYFRRCVCTERDNIRSDYWTSDGKEVIIVSWNMSQWQSASCVTWLVSIFEMMWVLYFGSGTYEVVYRNDLSPSISSFQALNCLPHFI